MDHALASPVILLTRDDALRCRIQAAFGDIGLTITSTFCQADTAAVLIDTTIMSRETTTRALARVAAIGGTHPPPLIFLTDDQDRASHVEALRAGAADVMPRGVELGLLTARITRLIAAEATLADALSLGKGALCSAIPPQPTATPKLVQIGDGKIPPMPGGPLQITDAPTLLSGAFDADAIIVAPTAPSEQLISMLTAHNTTRHVPIIALCPTDAERAGALRHGAGDAVADNVEADELAARVTQLVRHQQSIEQALSLLRAGLDEARRDALTGLHNRAFFDRRFPGLFHRAQLLGQPLSLLVFDIDGFKRINDQFGHAAGDRILEEFALRLSANVRAQDVVARYGGEEFVVAMPGAQDMVGLQAAERVRRAVAAPGFAISDDVHAQVTVSIGVAGLNRADTRAEDMLARADAAMFAAKTQGRNRVVKAA